MERIWVKTRGTMCPMPLLTSVMVPVDKTNVDDLKGIIKREFDPLLSTVPKPAVCVYYFNTSSEDYIPLAPDHMLNVNPLPEILKSTPGSDKDCPLYFDQLWKM